MNKQKVNMTEQERKDFDAKKKAAAQAYQKRKDDARAIVNEYMTSNPRIDEKVKQAILYLIGSGVRMPGVKGVGSALKEALLAGPLSPIEVFQKFEYGSPTMKQKIREFIVKAEPENRIWVELKDGKYQIVGKGPNPPKGWTGFVPMAKAESTEL